MKPVVLTMSRGPHLVPVARRLIRAMGAVADLPLERVEDAALICDALLDDGRANGRVTLTLQIRDDGLEMAFASPAGSAASSLTGPSLPDIGTVVDVLASGVWVERGDADTVDRLHVLVGPTG